MHYESQALISAPPQKIWDVLTDAPGYPQWEPNITKLDGRVAAHEKITLHTKVSPRAFPLKVTTFEPARKMEWSGGMPLGLFRGVRTFTLTPQGEQTEFRMREVFTGPLTGMMAKVMPDLTESFQQFAQALKTRCES